MRLLFMGTPDFAATILEQLINSEHEIIGVVTQPDKQKGRGKAISFSPVKDVALRHGFAVYQPVKVKEPDFLETVKGLKPEIIVVAAFGQILPTELLNLPPNGCINIHASLLPKYRGAAPIQYSIIDGEKETGITIMYMGAGLDTGDIILQKRLPIQPQETGGSLFEKMAVLGSEALLEALVQIKTGKSKRVPQDSEKATYVKMITKEMGRLDFTQPAIELERLIRGLNPWPSAYTFLDGKTLKLWRAEVEPGSPDSLYQPGEVTQFRKDALAVATGEGLLIIKELQLEGKKRMTVEAFLCGYHVQEGTILG